MTGSELALAPHAEQPLARLELACQLLAEARALDEVKQVVDLAEAARVYARQAHLGLDAQNDAAEIRLWAERRAGELLIELRKHAGGRPRASDSSEENLLQAVTGFCEPPRLVDLQITRRQSSQWQTLAGMPGPAFEAHIARTRGRRQELTTAGVLKAAQLGRQVYQEPSSSDSLPEVVGRGDDRFDVADAAHLPWPDGRADLLVCSPP